MDIEKRRKEEKQIIDLMIKIYCNNNHGTSDRLCPDCKKLSEYAQTRIDKCPFMETKTFCSNCKVHCYSEEMRNNIKKVMRYSGPRMMLYHPILAIKHAISSRHTRSN